MRSLDRINLTKKQTLPEHKPDYLCSMKCQLHRERSMYSSLSFFCFPFGNQNTLFARTLCSHLEIQMYDNRNVIIPSYSSFLSSVIIREVFGLSAFNLISTFEYLWGTYKASNKCAKEQTLPYKQISRLQRLGNFMYVKKDN